MLEDLVVECRWDERGEAWPERLRLGARVVQVEEVVDVWPGEGYRYLKLRDGHGHTWILRHDERSGAFEVTMFERAAQPSSAR
jgi:hypothetical protein